MADLHTYRKLPSDPCLSEEKILAYIDGKLSAAEQHACETHMADCAMCEDAVEGVAMVKDRSLLAVPLKTENEPAEGKVVPLHQPNRKVWYSVAAVLVLILGSTFLINIISSDGVSSEDMAYNQEAAYDSTVIAPGEGYATLENELDKQDADCLRSSTGVSGKDAMGEKNRDYVVTVTDANGAGPAEEPMTPPPAVDQEEEYMMTERIVADEVADGDAEDVQQKPEQTIVSKDKSGIEEDTKEEAEKKKNILDFATGIATGGTKRAEAVQKSKQDSYVDDNRNDGVQNAPAGNNAVVTNTNPQPESQKATMSGGVTSFDIAPTDSSAVVLAEVTTINAQDSVGAVVSDQLELSYQNGLNLLNAGQTSNAIVMFDKVLADKNHARYEDAEFQKAKALIKANKKEDAKTLLKAIEAKKGKHAAVATELLKTL